MSKNGNRSFVAFALILLTSIEVRAADDDPNPDNTSSFLAAPDNSKADSPAPPGGARTDPQNKRVGTWSLMADTRLDAVELSDVSTSFGLGVAYATLKTSTSLILRKGTVGSVSGSALDGAFGAFVLNPATQGVGASFQGMYFANSGRYCVPDCTKPETTFSGAQFGVFVSFDVGAAELNAKLPDETERKVKAVAGALSLAPVVRIADSFVVGGVERPIALGLYFGPTSRLVGGDVRKSDRETILGNEAASYLGLEAGLFFQLASAELSMKVSQLWPSGDDADVAGLSGFQLAPKVAFSLPFDIVQFEPRADKAGPVPAVAAPSAAAPAAPAAPSPVAPSPAAPSPAAPPPAGVAPNPN